MSEIDGFDWAVTSGSKEDARAFIDEFGSSHLIPDLIALLPPDVAAAVCADLPSGASTAANRACEQLQDVIATAPEAGTISPQVVTAEEGDLAAVEEDVSFQRDVPGNQDGSPSNIGSTGSGDTDSDDGSSDGVGGIIGGGAPGLGQVRDLEQRVRDIAGAGRPGF